MASTKFQVVIVGGGVAGLTLANALERAEVEYVLLESREEFAPSIGASIALAANGNRILDQLGCYDILESHATPLTHIQTWMDGQMVRDSDQLTLNHKRLGYPIFFVDRHFLLDRLYDNIRDKGRLLLGKRVSRIDQNHKAATVQCKDGTTYTGDVVVGADGVHSVVRREMFRHLEVDQPGLRDAEEKTAMSSEYKCMYGVSKPIEGLKQRLFSQVLGHDLSFLHTLDKSGRVFWFVFEKMDKVYHVPNVPKFADEDAVALAHRSSSVRMNDMVRFGDLWDNRLAYKLVPLEEGIFRHWTWGRLICIGDSIHKWTPNIGQGGNNAIESAACLANALYRLALLHETPSRKEVERSLSSVPERRQPRAKSAFKNSNLATRLEALKGPKEELLMLSVFPRVGEWLVNRAALAAGSAEKLDFLQDPPRSYQGTMAFNQNYGPGAKKSLKRRAVTALPLLMLGLLVHRIFSNILSQPGLQSQIDQCLRSGQVEFSNQAWSLPTYRKPFDLLVTLFSPSLLNIDPAQRMQTTSFLIDLGPLWLIFTLEAHRRANQFKIITLPVIFGIAFQLLGIGVVGPVWFFLHFLQSPVSDYAALDWRLVNVAAAKTVGFAVALTLTIPTLAMYHAPDSSQRLMINAAWQAFPVLTSIVHYLLRKCAVKDTTKDDRIYNVEADLPSVRLTVWAFAGISALVFNWVRFFSGSSLTRIFFPDWTALTSMIFSGQGQLDLVSSTRLLFEVDEIACFAAAFLWLAFLINDLKEAEMASVRWPTALAFVAAGTYLLGPGAVVALTWWWREKILATKKAKGSVVDRT